MKLLAIFFINNLNAFDYHMILFRKSPYNIYFLLNLNVFCLSFSLYFPMLQLRFFRRQKLFAENVGLLRLLASKYFEKYPVMFCLVKVLNQNRLYTSYQKSGYTDNRHLTSWNHSIQSNSYNLKYTKHCSQPT